MDEAVSAATTPVSPARSVPLRRNWRFQLLWLGSSTGFVGMEVADIGYPLAILAVTGSPAETAMFGVVQTLASLALGLPAGDVVDRHDRRRLLLLVEAGRALAAGSVAAALAAHHLTLVHLLGVAAVLGAGAAFGAPARMLIVRAVVPQEQLTAALTQEEARDSASRLIGPPLGGALYGLKPLLPFLFSALAFVVSWICALIVRIPPSERSSDADSRARPAATGKAGRRMFVGVKALWEDPTLRAATLVVTALNTAAAPLALIAVVILNQQGTPPWMIGIALSGMAVGSLAGTPLIGPLHRRLKPGVLLLTVVLTEVPVFAALAIPLGPWWVMAVLSCATLGVPALRVLVDVLIFRQVPDEQRGRVIAAVIMLFGVGAPAGTAVAGLLLQYLSPSVAVVAIAAGLALASCRAATHRDLRQAQWPK